MNGVVLSAGLDRKLTFRDFVRTVIDNRGTGAILKGKRREDLNCLGIRNLNLCFQFNCPLAP